MSRAPATLFPPGVGPVLAAQRFDEAALRSYLQGRLPGIGEGLTVRQFSGGQSNPTFLLSCADGQRYVLRKKPPGKLLPKAHQIEREYRVMSALAGTAVPVPRMHLLCEEEAAIGTAFYVMDYVAGRVSSEPAAPDLTPAERRASREDMAAVLARLHAVDWRAAGLADFGRPEGYLARQVARWGQQVEASRTDVALDDLDWLKDWLAERTAEAALEREATVIAHGDFRPGNMILSAAEPKVVAVLDWELATLGHPIADLAYFCLPYHLPAGIPGVRGLVGLDIADLGLPSEAEIVAGYCRHAGRERVENWPLLLAFSLFRLAAILQGIAARAQQGNASSADAKTVGSRAGLLAATGRKIAEEAQVS